MPEHGQPCKTSHLTNQKGNCLTQVLALYDTTARSKISADASASAYGLGAALFQQQQDKWCPVTFALQALSETEL